MKWLYNPSQLFEELIDQICPREERRLYSPKQVVINAYNLIFQTILSPEACKE